MHPELEGEQKPARWQGCTVRWGAAVMAGAYQLVERLAVGEEVYGRAVAAPLKGGGVKALGAMLKGYAPARELLAAAC